MEAHEEVEDGVAARRDAGDNAAVLLPIGDAVLPHAHDDERVAREPAVLRPGGDRRGDRALLDGGEL